MSVDMILTGGPEAGRFLLFAVTKRLQCRITGQQRVCGDSLGERRPMDMMLTSALTLLIVGCVVGYSLRAKIASDRPTEPRRRRPF
jgi:hypothetical protein